MQTKILYLFTRTPIHVGAGASVGAIDQPVQRERHTGFPIIPATSLKGSFADHWNDQLIVRGEGEKAKKIRGSSIAAWLFGSDDPNTAFAGSLLFAEARLLAFPIRSAKGSFAWITCPLLLQRAKRDGVISTEIPDEPDDEKAIFKSGGPLALGTEIVLEDYSFADSGSYPDTLAEEIAKLMPAEEVFRSISNRLVILSNGIMSHFAITACEVAQHVRISDETGTAEGTALFNQENVPADTLFYAKISATKSRVPDGDSKGKSAEDALAEFERIVADKGLFQFGGDASTGLGWCTVTISPVQT